MWGGPFRVRARVGPESGLRGGLRRDPLAVGACGRDGGGIEARVGALGRAGAGVQLRGGIIQRLGFAGADAADAILRSRSAGGQHRKGGKGEERTDHDMLQKKKGRPVVGATLS